MIAGVKQIAEDKSVKGVVVRGAGRAFCAGAEISEFAEPGESLTEGLVETLFRLESLSVPVVALVHGFALGGGFEVSLNCHYRLGSSDAQFGLPEVNLGLLPGAGGTQRLPRLIGVIPSSDMLLYGNPVNAEKALKLGLIDGILKEKTVEGRLKEAVSFLQSLNGTIKRISDLKVPDADQPDVIGKLDSILKIANQKRKGEIAPDRIISCLKAAVLKKTFQEGMKEEARLFAQLLASPEARALQHIFFAERAAAKIPKELTAEPQKISRVGVIGAGLMGGGIAMCCVDVGIPTVIIDVSQEFLNKGLDHIRINYSKSVERKSSGFTECIGYGEIRVSCTSCFSPSPK